MSTETSARPALLRTFVYRGQSKDQIPTDVEHLIVHASVPEIPRAAFWQLPSLQKVEIESGATKKIGALAFGRCMHLLDVVIPDTLVEIEDSAFGFCHALQNATLATGLERIGRYAFQKCNALTKITIPSTVVEIGDGAFDDCSSLSTVELQMGIQKIGNYAFYGCNALPSVAVPSSVTEFGSNVFDQCARLRSIDMLNGPNPNLPLAIRLSTKYATRTPNITAKSLVARYFPHKITAKDLFQPCEGTRKQQQFCRDVENTKLEEIKCAFAESMRCLVAWRAAPGNMMRSTTLKRKAEA